MQIVSKSFQLVSPSPDKCQCCAIKHGADEPHDASSLFYQTWFNLQHDRFPTWLDAMSHCSEAAKRKWSESLNLNGIDINSTNTRGIQ